VKSFVLEVPPHVAPLASFKAGQWVDLFAPNVEQVGGFSIVSPPWDLTPTLRPMGATLPTKPHASTFELAVKQSKHPAAIWLHKNASVGNRVLARVGGSFFYPPRGDKVPPPRNVLLLAGGIGITPLFSIFQAALFNAATEKVVLVHSARDPAEFVFRERVMHLSKAQHTSKISAYYVETGETANRGLPLRRIDELFLRDLLEKEFSGAKRNDLDVFLCGPPGMTEAMEESLLACQVSKDHILYEVSLLFANFFFVAAEPHAKSFLFESRKTCVLAEMVVKARGFKVKIVSYIIN
jgi:ferredoxin-NADP reductase